MVIKERALIRRVVTRKSEDVVCGEFRVVSFFPSWVRKVKSPQYFISLRIAIVWISVLNWMKFSKRASFLTSQLSVLEPIPALRLCGGVSGSGWLLFLWPNDSYKLSKVIQTFLIELYYIELWSISKFETINLPHWCSLSAKTSSGVMRLLNFLNSSDGPWWKHSLDRHREIYDKANPNGDSFLYLCTASIGHPIVRDYREHKQHCVPASTKVSARNACRRP